MLVDIHESDDRGNVYTLREPGGLAIFWAGLSLTVPEGFESDGASVPRFFWRAVFPPGDTRALRAAFCHDFIYRTHPLGWMRTDADSLFLELLLEHGTPFFRALLAYIGVRLFGRIAWKRGGAA